MYTQLRLCDIGDIDLLFPLVYLSVLFGLKTCCLCVVLCLGLGEREG